MGRVLKVLLGLLVGGAVGYGLLYIGRTEGLFGYLGCAVTGALVGLICGRAPWKADTIWTPVLKMIFGMLVGAGAFALGSHVLPAQTFTLPVQGLPGALGVRTAAVLAPAIGLLYGLFVEVDDGGSSERERKEKERQKARKELGV